MKYNNKQKTPLKFNGIFLSLCGPYEPVYEPFYAGFEDNFNEKIMILFIFMAKITKLVESLNKIIKNEF